MKAVLYTEFGDTDVLQVQDVDAPHAGAGQIRLRVVSAGMNPVDVKIRHGWMADMASQLPATPGLEAAGIVDEVGEGVHGVAVATPCWRRPSPARTPSTRSPTTGR
ncbi:alcohol dehydrogenase catalytic domain-containing protein [Rathayibacter tanaceti]|uniref:alcohol dehydrogenase catalytic domain-containing protein n=1 Tax=Rathayibacter tanaceti TaxID=1671680 RepID=UPI00191C0EBA|nr:alcohol dehydrogenase catalytic domain-containing protein [Rathayibacter tanaceti]